MFLRWGRKKSWSFLCISCNRILLSVVHFRCHKWPYLILYRYKIKPSIVKHHSLTVENLASWPEQQFLYGIWSFRACTVFVHVLLHVLSILRYLNWRFRFHAGKALFVLNIFATACTWKRYTDADLEISQCVRVHIKTILWKFRILNPKNSWIVVVFLKSRLLFKIFYCFCMFVSKHFIYLGCA